MKQSQEVARGKYSEVYTSALDSLNNWELNKLKTYEFLNLYPYKLDSLLCFNREYNKMISAILVGDHITNNHNSDAIIYFYGIVINSKWYFFNGPTIVLPRDQYQKEISTPLSFTKLHEIALEEIYAGYLTPQGEISEKFFSVFKKDAYNYPFTTQKAWEASYLKLVAENWNKRDTTKPIIHLSKKEPLP